MKKNYLDPLTAIVDHDTDSSFPKESIATLRGTASEIIFLLRNQHAPSVRLLDQYKATVIDLCRVSRALYSDTTLQRAYEILISNISRLLCESFAHAESLWREPLGVGTPTELLRAEEFRAKGYFQFQMEKATLDWCKKILEPYTEKLRVAMRRGESSREQCSTNQIDQAIVRELGQRLAESGLVRAVSAGFGRPVRAAGFALELSVPNALWWSAKHLPIHDKAARTAYFHRDETISVPKAIVYLSEVSDQSGPFQIVSKSFNTETDLVCMAASRVVNYPLRHLERVSSADQGNATLTKLKEAFYKPLPSILKTDSHFGFYLEDDSEASVAIMSNIETFVGSAGQGICFDGYSLFHRGGLALQEPRLALQIMLPSDRSSEQHWIEKLSV